MSAALVPFWADTGGVGGDRVDFFVSHAVADRVRAEWVAWQLADVGYTVELDVWGWAAGQNFVTAMSGALDRCDRGPGSGAGPGGREDQASG